MKAREEFFTGMIPHSMANYEYAESDLETEDVLLNQNEELLLDEIRTFEILKSISEEKRNVLLSFTAKADKNYLRNPTVIRIEYGKGDKVNGSTLVSISPRGNPDFIVHISSQYNWHLKQNDWIRFKNNE